MFPSFSNGIPLEVLRRANMVRMNYLEIRLEQDWGCEWAHKCHLKGVLKRRLRGCEECPEEPPP